MFLITNFRLMPVKKGLAGTIWRRGRHAMGDPPLGTLGQAYAALPEIRDKLHWLLDLHPEWHYQGK
jgi:hypothetical protein